MTVYGLLVGIDKYPISPLKGCLNDVNAMTKYLQQMVTPRPSIKILLNEQATRHAIIKNFREHLGQAKENDIVLFFYSGHGSQEEASEEFREIESDQLHETLVCWDSRHDKGLDLADKELLKLINEVALNKPSHIVIILDCCHSGGAVRTEETELYTGRRSLTKKRQKRSLDDFIFSPEEIKTLSPPQQCILLAACQENQKAGEFSVDRQYRGLFSYCLLDSLKRANGNLTYRDLFNRTKAITINKALVENLASECLPTQVPRVEISDILNFDRQFLGGSIAKCTSYFTVSYDRQYGWVLDGGSVQGILLAQDRETTTLALFPSNSSGETLRQLNQKIATAEVTEVLPHLSKIITKESLDPKLTYKAIVISSPAPRLKVYFQGEEAGINLVRRARQTANFNAQPSLYVREVSNLEEADFCLLAQNTQYLIARKGNNHIPIAPIQDYSPEKAEKVIQTLEHIARWQSIATLSNPVSSLSRYSIQLHIIQGEEEIETSQIVLRYDEQNSQPPSFKIKLTNQSDEPLYCVLLNLTERYAVKTGLLPGGGIWLQKGETAWALQGKHIYPRIPEQLRKKGITKYKDILKLIVSTNEVNATLLELQELELAMTCSREKDAPIWSFIANNQLNHLLNRLQARGLYLKLNDDKVLADWITSDVVINIIEKTY